jgi:hypothetical protein
MLKTRKPKITERERERERNVQSKLKERKQVYKLITKYKRHKENSGR